MLQSEEQAFTKHGNAALFYSSNGTEPSCVSVVTGYPATAASTCVVA